MGVSAATGAPWWQAVGAVTAVVVLVGLIDVMAALPPAALEVTRTTPNVVRLGGDSELTWRVRNASRRSVTVAWAEQIPLSLGGERRRSARIAARGEVEASTVLSPSLRGRHQLGPITLRVAGPLGLAGRQSSVGEVEYLDVLPAAFPVQPLRAGGVRRAQPGSGPRYSSRVGGHGDFQQLRDYVDGDDPRLIDWNATARLDRPIVRTQGSEQYRPVILVVDTGRTMAARMGGPPLLDHVITAVAGFAAAVDRFGDRVALLAYDSFLRAEVSPGRGRRMLSAVTEELLVLQPTLRESDHSGALVTAGTSGRGRSTVVMFTELDRPSVEHRLLPALTRHGGANSILVAAVRDPSWERIADDGDLSSPALALAAAAARRLDERAACVAAIESLGVTVVDATPSMVVPSLVSAYQRMREREFRAAGRGRFPVFR